MTERFTFQLDINIDTEAVMRIHGEKWIEAFRESADEFAQEMTEFMEKHPFIEGCSMQHETIK